METKTVNLSPPAFEIRFDNSCPKVELIDSKSKASQIPPPFRKRDKIRSSFEYSHQQTESTPVTSTLNMEGGPHSDSLPPRLDSRQKNTVDFDDVVIPTVYKRLKMNQNITDKVHLDIAEQWYSDHDTVHIKPGHSPELENNGLGFVSYDMTSAKDLAHTEKSPKDKRACCIIL
ncbi:hypothetical protein K7432_014150 [Basidiobolus ranarum]|uniref:Uncharacterized protein n=1 Tax=Basidiobolus ranarum TaxID=34480 RepID=A0ABR2WI36_9FUNG